VLRGVPLVCFNETCILVLLFSLLTGGAGSIKVFSAFNAIDRSIGSAEMRVVSSSWSGAVKVITLY